MVAVVVHQVRLRPLVVVRLVRAAKALDFHTQAPMYYTSISVANVSTNASGTDVHTDWAVLGTSPVDLTAAVDLDLAPAQAHHGVLDGLASFFGFAGRAPDSNSAAAAFGPPDVGHAVDSRGARSAPSFLLAPAPIPSAPSSGGAKTSATTVYYFGEAFKV